MASATSIDTIQLTPPMSVRLNSSHDTNLMQRVHKSALGSYACNEPLVPLAISISVTRMNRFATASSEHLNDRVTLEDRSEYELASEDYDDQAAETQPSAGDVCSPSCHRLQGGFVAVLPPSVHVLQP